ncbi:hypothetical protein EKO27_g11015 [Xylaria grammica]|uniref:BTB domain-containing protein n=1 Tax=Xylaria grammica TaxID=363999 RepID=A0A439CPL6_9PEZI|nr:hypothetical protein EKO27_g11015 [Xylaria grammica]
MVIRKHELEAKLKHDLELVQSGVLRDENPLDSSEEFNELLEACRRGDLKRTQELISAGVNLNGKDKFDYTPLIIASLCGHYELVELLLESGALAERDTFQGERCIYNALNDKIRNLLLKYDYSKSTDPLQPWAAHITSLFTREVPKTSDITLMEGTETFELHKFVLSARSPYFQKKLREAPDTTMWKLPLSKPVESFRIVLRYLYLGDIPREVVDARSNHSEEEVLTGIDKISKQLEIPRLWEAILSGHDRRLVRQRHQDEVNRAQQQVDDFFNQKTVCYGRTKKRTKTQAKKETQNRAPSPSAPELSRDRKMVPLGTENLFFIRAFMEAQESEHLHVIKIDCLPQVLEIILRFLYTEQVECPLEFALDLLYASDMLLLDKLKSKAAVLISSLGSGNNNVLVDRTHGGSGEAGVEVEPINVYDVIHAAWDLRVQRLETFAARYLAFRLEDYIDEEEFAELIQESAARVRNREETDTIELLDDIRYYLGDRFRLRFEDAGLDEMLDESGEIDASVAEALSSQLQVMNDTTELSRPLESEKATITYSREALTAKQPGVDGGVRTLDGELAEDEFVSDAINYQVLLQKIDIMLEKLKLDA